MDRAVGLAMAALLVVACGPGAPLSRTDPDEHFRDVRMLSAADRSVSGDDLPPKTLALTFDDGPSEQTLPIARFLAANGIEATFFVVGQHAAGREWVLDELTRLGHRVGNHTHFVDRDTDNHWRLGDPRAPAPTDNVAACHDVIAPVVVDDVYLFRAPFFFYDRSVAQSLRADPRTNFYLGPIRARIGGGSNPDDTPGAGHMGDWQCWTGLASSSTPHPFTPEQCADIYFREITATGNPDACSNAACDHGVVLMHDYDAAWESAHGTLENHLTLELVQNLVPRLRAAGYQFTSLEEVPAVRKMIAHSQNPNARPADWARYPRSHRVHWHRLRVSEASPAGPGTLSHSFERDVVSGRLSWDEQDLGRCAQEIAATTSPDGTAVLVMLGCGGSLETLTFAAGSAPSGRFAEVKLPHHATALLDVVASENGDVQLQYVDDGPTGTSAVKLTPHPGSTAGSGHK